MDLNYTAALTRLAGTVLAFSVVCNSAGAEETFRLPEVPPSMLIVTATDAGEALVQPPAVAATKLVVSNADGLSQPPGVAGDQLRLLPAVIEMPVGEAGQAPSDLTVVANPQRKGLLAAFLPDSDVTEVAAEEPVEPKMQAGGRPRWFSSGPNRPPVAAGIQTRQHANRFVVAPSRSNGYSIKSQADNPGPAIQVARHDAASEMLPAIAAPGVADPAADLLIRAHELSLSASAEAEYSQIVRSCADAMRHNPQGDSRQFGLQLSAWALNRRGQLRSDDGQRDLALADFRAALEFDSNNWRALHNRGVALAQLGQFAEAFDDVCRVIQLNPSFAKGYSNRATLYVQARDFERAMADYESALRLDGSLLPALVGHGRVCHMAGQREKGLASLTKAIELAPSDAETVCSRGDLLADLGRYEEAMQDYARAIDLNPKLEHAYRNGAWLLATCPEEKVRDVNGALVGAQKALECGYGDRHAALDTLAAALANAGKYEEAVGTIQQAIDIAPADAQAAYLARQQLYESRQPFRTLPVAEVLQAGFEAQSK